MTARRRLFTQGTHYALGNFLGMLLGVVTLAVYTRIFPVEEYGIYSLVAVTMGIVSVLSLAGVPQAAIRFYWKYRADAAPGVAAADAAGAGAAAAGAAGDSAAASDPARSGSGYAAQVLRKGVLLSLAVTAAAMLLFLAYGSFRGWRVARLLILAAAAVPFAAATELALAFLRARQATFAYNGVALARGVLTLACSLGAIFGVERSLAALFAGRVLGEAAASVLALAALGARERLRGGETPAGAYAEALRFGAPLLFFFAGSSLLASGDRYLIEFLLGHTAVGIYSLGYSVAERAMNLALMPTYLVVFPIYTERWEKEGPEATTRFLKTAMRLYAGLVLPVAVGISGVSRELTLLLATEKYLGATLVYPYVALSLFLYGLSYLTAAGLYIAQRTGEIAAVMLVSGIANILLNLVLIPKYGLLGAAIATLLGYVVYAILTAALARKRVTVEWPWAAFAKAAVAAAALGIFLRAVRIEAPLASLAIKVPSGAALYLALLAALDRDFRRIALEFLAGGGKSVASEAGSA